MKFLAPESTKCPVVKGATYWQIHLHPAVSFDITAHSNGGSVKLDLAGMAIAGVLAETGGGNVSVNTKESPEEVTLLISMQY